VVLCTPDKDLAQCVAGRRVVQLDRRTGTTFDEDGVMAKFGVPPRSIAHWLALVGDSADGFPGLVGWGRRSAATVLAHYGTIGAIPDRIADWDPAVRRAVRGSEKLAQRLAADRALAELFLDLATLRVDESLLGGVGELRWTGPTEAFDAVCQDLRDQGLADRAAALGGRRGA
jgi:5'-3' exonuclease